MAVGTMQWACRCFVVCGLVGLSMSKVGFIKDQAMDVVFPGPVYRQAPSLPEGHMRPLGWQRRPDGPIKEENEMPNTQEFFENFVTKKKPVVFRSSLTEAPVFDTWQDDNYLTEKYGHLNISVRVKLGRKKDKIISEAQTMKFKKFLYDYMYDEWYVASIVPQEMMEELPLPKCVRCGTIAERLYSAQLWMSSGGTSSRVHSHDEHLLHCVLFGRRDFILVEGIHRRAFDFHEDFPGSQGGHSDMNTEKLNAFKYKHVLKTPWIWTTLYPGDCLYVPSGFIHQVRSYGRSISETIEFADAETFDNSGCTLIEEDFVPLTDAFFLLAFQNGKVSLSEEKIGVYEMYQILDTLMGRSDILTEGKFAHFYNTITGEDPDYPNAKRVFEWMLRTVEDVHVTRTDLKRMSQDTLQKVADAFNGTSEEEDPRRKNKGKRENEKKNKERPKTASVREDL